MGTLVVLDGTAQLVGPLPVASRLFDLVTGNLGRLQPAQRAALNIVAVAQPLPLRLLRRVVATDDLRAAERDGVIRLRSSRLDGVDRHVAVVGQPLYGEAALAALTPLDRQLLLESLIDAARIDLAADEGMAYRVAAWCIEVGRSAPLDDLIAAIRLAHRALDPKQAQRVARALWRRQPSADTGLL